MKEISPAVRFALVMVFAGVALAASLANSGLGLALGAGVWTFVVGGFGTYLYFRMLRPRK